MSAFAKLHHAERACREARERFENGSGRSLPELQRAEAEYGVARRNLERARYAADLAEGQARVREAA